jgi:hypothetical protein
MKPPVQSSSPKIPRITPKESLISKIFGPFLDIRVKTMGETPLFVSQETIKAMIIDGDRQYQDAFEKGDRDLQMWFDGYIRALYRVLEYHDQ